MIENTDSFQISRNKWGHYEHRESALVFNADSKRVYGKQTESGVVVDLTPADIDLCNKHKVEYVLPINLDHETSDKPKRTIERIDEEDEEEIEELEELEDE